MEVIFSNEVLNHDECSPTIPIHLNSADKEVSQPGIIATLKENGRFVATLKIFQTDNDYFLYNRFIQWQSWTVLGCGSHIHFISQDLKVIKSISLGASAFSCFEEFYTSMSYPKDMNENILLVASGTGLTLLNNSAEILWQLDQLAVDGTMVHDIKNNIIYGSAEHDPPDGWEDFEVSLTDGKIIKM